MIEPAPAQRNSLIGQQHGLQKLTETLEALSQGQTQQAARDQDLLQALATSQYAHTTLDARMQRLWWTLGALAAGMLLSVVLAGVTLWKIEHLPITNVYTVPAPQAEPPLKPGQRK
jgi:hypothetical protein